jgi:hypothetical protein
MRVRRTAAVAIALAATAGSPAAQDAGETDGVERLGFMVGCWEGNANGGTIEESWTPAANLMLSTTRYLEDGHVTGFEFALITIEGGHVAMTPFPEGVRSEHGFPLEPGGSGQAVFAAPEHDFPKRILYAATTGDSLRVRIDGGEGSDQAAEWSMGRVDCDRRE